MSWFGSASEWKQGLSSTALNKVEELESQTEKLKKERLQKQNQLDTLQQALDKQKRKNEEEMRLRQSFEKENEHLAQTCELLQSKLHKGGTDTSGMSTDSFNLGAEKVLRKKIQDLENEIKNLQNKCQEGHKKDVTDQMLSQNDPFWRRFSSSSSEGSLPPYKSPAKIISKKALETSDENPFKAPPATPHKKGLEISDENPFKTPRKYDSATTLPQAPASTLKTDYSIQLEKKLESALQEIEDLKRERNVPSNQTSQDVQICSLKTELEKTKSDHTTQGQQLHSATDQLLASNTKAQDLEIKVNTLEQRVKLLQTELDCQRQNSETAKQHLEEKLKEKEREFNAEVSRFQKELGTSELQLQELSGKLLQQEAFALGNQNSLRASIDKLSSQLSSMEKEKILAQNQASQFESSVNRLQKSEDDSKVLLTQLRQERDMIKAQVDTLKVKLSDAESLTNRLQSQLASSEQLAINHKVSLEDAVASHKSVIEKEKQSHKIAIENVVTEKDKLLKEAKCKVSELEAEMAAKKEDFVSTQNEKNEALLKLKQTEEDCLQRLAGVIELETKCNKLAINVEEKQKLIENQEKVLQDEFEETKFKLGKEVQMLQMSLERVREEEKANLQEVLKKVEIEHEQEFSKVQQKVQMLQMSLERVKEEEKANLQEALKKVEEEKEQEFSKVEQKAEEMEERLSLSQKSEEKARSEKLAVELNIWELEGRIEGLTKAEISLQQQNKELVEKIFQLEDSLRTENNVAAAKTAEVEGLNKRLQEMATTLASLVATLEGVKAKLQSSEDRVAEMTKEIDRSKTELGDRDSKIESLIEERLQCDLSLVETNAQYEKLAEESRQNNDCNMKRVQYLLQEKQALVLECESFGAQLTSAQSECRALEETRIRERQDYETRLNTFESELEALNRENNELRPLQERVTELTENKKTLEETSALHESHAKQLKEMVQNLTDSVMKLEEQKESETHKYKAEIDSLIRSNAIIEKEVTENASTLIESEKYIKILQDQNESLSQTLVETNENLSQVNTSIESLKENLAKARYECEQVTLEKDKFVEQVNQLQKDYDLIKVQLEQSDSRLSEQLSSSQDKEKECAERTRLLDEVTTAMNSLKERFSAMTEENKIEEEELSLKLSEQKDINQGLRQDIDIYKEKIEASEASIQELRVNLSAKDVKVTDLQKSNTDIKEEFTSKLTNFNKQVDSLKDQITAKEEQSAQLENEIAQTVQVCDELRAKLSHQEDVNRCLSLEFEDYKEVANMMRRETINQEETMKEVERLRDLNGALETKVSDLSKSVIEVQRKNCELSSPSLPKKDLKDSEIQVDGPRDRCCSHCQDITKLEKELNEREAEVVELGDRIQDLFAEVDNLQMEKEDLKKRLKEQEVITSLSEDGKHNISSGDSILIEALKDELNQTKLYLQRAQEKSIFNVTLAQELDEKVQSLRNELNLKVTAEKDLRAGLDSAVKREDFEQLEGAFCRLKTEHKKLQDELKVTQNQLESSFPCDKITQKERELSELTQELICENGKLEAKNNDIMKENADLEALKDILNNQVEESLAQNNIYERDIQNFQQKLDEFISENSSLANENRMQKLTLEELDMERSSLVESNKKLLGENTQLISQNEDLKEKHKLLDEHIRVCKNDSRKYICEIESKMEETLKAKSNEIKDLVKRSNTLEKELEVKDKQIRELIAQHLTRSECVEMRTEECEQQTSGLNSRISALEEFSLDAKEREFQALEQNYLKVQNDMENSFTKLKCEVEDLSLKLDNSVEELNQSKIKEEELNLAMANLTQKLSFQEEENRKLKELNLELGEKQEELNNKINIIDQLGSTITNLESDIANLARQSEELKIQNQCLREEVESKSLLVKEKDEMVAKQQKDLLNLTKQLEVTAKHEETLNTDLKILQEELNSSVANLTKKLSCQEEENRILKESNLELGEKQEELNNKINIIDQLGSTITNLESDIANLARQSEELKIQNQCLREEVESKSLLVKEKDEMVAKQQKDLLNLTKQLEVTAKHEETLNTDLKILQEELNSAVANLTKKLSCQEEENRILKESNLELGEKQEELNNKINIIDQLGSTITNLESDIANLARQSEELKIQNQCLREEVESKSLLVKEKDEMVAKQQKDLLNLTKQLEVTAKHEETLNTDLKILQEELNSAVANLTKKLSCQEEENRKLKESNLELGEKQEELNNKINIIDQLGSTITNLESDVTNLARQSEELKSQNQCFQEEAENRSLLVKEKDEMVAKQQKDLLNLTKQLEMSAKHEKALNEDLKSMEASKSELLTKLDDLTKVRTEIQSCLSAADRKIQIAEKEMTILRESKAAVIEENVGLNMLKAELLMKIENYKVKDKSEQEQSMKWKEEVQTVRSSLNAAETSLQHTRKEEEKLVNLMKSKELQIQDLESCIKRTITIMLKMKENLDGIGLIVPKNSVPNVKNDNSILESCSKEHPPTPTENSSVCESTEVEMLCQELIAKVSNIQSHCKELESRVESLQGELRQRDEMLSERKIQMDAIQKELFEVKEEMRKEQHKFQDKCAENDILNETIKKRNVQLKDCSKHVGDAEADLAKLKAKFVTLQTSGLEKDQDLSKAHTAINKLERDDKKMKKKLKEIHMEAKEKETKFAGAKKEIEDWERKFNQKSVQLLELKEKCLQSEKNAESLHEKLCKLQLRNKQLQSDLATKRKVTKAPQLLSDTSSNLSKDSQQTTDIVDCSQSQDKTLNVNLEASVKKAATRRAAMIGQTSSDVKSTKIGTRGSGRKLPLKAVESQQEILQVSTPSDQEPSSFEFHSTRRITRSFYSEKRAIPSSREEFSAKKIRLGDLEGLPDKVRRGLNDIPEGQQSPGIITRPTTPLKQMSDNTSRGPLKLLDPNFERTKNSTVSDKISEPRPDSASELPKDRVKVEIPSQTDSNTEADKRDLVSRSSFANPKSGALRSRNKLRKPQNVDDCRAQ